MTDFMGEPLNYWRQLSWWPEGWVANVMGGPPGHEREIVVGFDGRYDWDNAIPGIVVEIFAQLLPDPWKVESRGTRIEIHPSGHFSGGYHADDIPAVVRALTEIGFNAKVTYP